MSFEAKLICYGAKLISSRPELIYCGSNLISCVLNPCTYRLERIFSEGKYIDFRLELNDFGLKLICYKPKPWCFKSVVVAADAKLIGYGLEIICPRPALIFAKTTCISFELKLIYVT